MLMRLWIKLKMLLMSIITLLKKPIRIESQDFNLLRFIQEEDFMQCYLIQNQDQILLSISLTQMERTQLLNGLTINQKNSKRILDLDS